MKSAIAMVFLMTVIIISGCTQTDSSGLELNPDNLEISYVMGVYNETQQSIVVTYRFFGYPDKVKCNFYMDGIIAKNLYEELFSGQHTMAVDFLKNDIDMEKTHDVGVCCGGACKSEKLEPSSWVLYE